MENIISRMSLHDLFARGMTGTIAVLAARFFGIMGYPGAIENESAVSDRSGVDSNRSDVYSQIDKTLLDYVKDANDGFPDFTAINFRGRKIKYSAFLKQVAEMEQVFRKAGIRGGDAVSILYLATPEVIYTMYALNSMHVTVNFLNPMGPESIVEALEEERPRYILCYERFLELIEGKVEKERIILLRPTDCFSKPVQLLDSIKEKRKKAESCGRISKPADMNCQIPGRTEQSRLLMESIWAPAAAAVYRSW